MWARRCGAPRRCPSRVKVIIFSFFSGTVGLSIYTYMATSNVSYLDLKEPASAEVLCLTEWPLRAAASPWAALQHWLNDESAIVLEPEELLVHARCEVPSMVHASCRTVAAPIVDMTRPLALAMGGPPESQYDVLGTWAHLFLAITFCIWIGMLTHDLALIGQGQRDFILDVSGVNEHCPVIRSVWRCLAGYRTLQRLVSQEQPGVRATGISLAALLAPALLAWNLVVFLFVVVPLLLLAFARFPIRMSRAWVFIVSIACSIYGFALAIHQVVYMVDSDRRPRYAVTWQPMLTAATTDSTGEGTLSECICGCDYPISMTVLIYLTIIGVGTSIRSIFVAVRCLKGLRRSQWANLLSVLFPVPVTVYTVDWKQKNGQPIRFRTEDIAVQEEVAFDPFAMMDEQLDSAYTTVHLRPEPVHTWERAPTGELTLVRPHRKLEMPSIPAPYKVQVMESEYVGCCGFPWPTGGKQCVYESEFMMQLGSSWGQATLSPVAQPRVPEAASSEASPSASDADALSAGGATGTEGGSDTGQEESGPSDASPRSGPAAASRGAGADRGAVAWRRRRAAERQQQPATPRAPPQPEDPGAAPASPPVLVEEWEEVTPRRGTPQELPEATEMLAPTEWEATPRRGTSQELPEATELLAPAEWEVPSAPSTPGNPAFSL